MAGSEIVVAGSFGSPVLSAGGDDIVNRGGHDIFLMKLTGVWGQQKRAIAM